VCDEKDILLIFDEVQTGMGRTGTMFAYQQLGVEPDLMTLAKSLGGGFPIGALVVNNKRENVLVPGTHASTFGGNPLAAVAGIAVFETIEKGNLLKKTNIMGSYLCEKFEALKEKYSCITEVRGLGLMRAIQLTIPGAQIVEKAMQLGLLINCTQGDVLRICPAITVTKKEIDTAIVLLDRAIGESV